MKKKLQQFIRFTADFMPKEKMILRDHLAMERTKLANERTLFAYIRTSLYLLLGGIALLGLKEAEELNNLGTISIILSIAILIIGIVRFLRLKKQLKKCYLNFEEYSDEGQEKNGV